MYDKTVRRRRAVLALLVASSLILLTAYFGESAGGGLHAVQRGVLEVVSPIQEGASRALKPFRDLFGWIGDTVDAKGENRKLRKERDRLARESAAGANAVRENRKLKGLLELSSQLALDDYGLVTARVIGQSPTLWHSTINIDKGSSAGIEIDMPVVASDGEGSGLVGKVTTVTGGTAIVTLITDSTLFVGARTARGDSKGVVQSEVGRPGELILKYTRRTDPLDKGNLVVTSGTESSTRKLESIYPPGLPIGRITRIDDQGTDAQEPHLKPDVDMRRLEFVQVLTRKVNGNRR